MTTTTDCSTCSSDEPSSEPASEEPTSLSNDDIFHILQTNRRRDAIRYLLDEDGPVKMRDVAEHVAARENETTVAKLTSSQRQRVYIPLYQSHLPKLDEEGIIEYNQSRGIVHPTERLEIFRPYLEASENGPSQSEDATRADGGRTGRDYYLPATGASASLLVATATGLLAIPGVALGAIITMLFVLATVVTSLSHGVSSADGPGPHSVN